MPAPSVTVIVNPAAGRGKGARLLPRLEQALAGLEVDFVARVSEGPRDPERMAAEAAQNGCRIVAALGGDGLVGMIANALVGTDTALAVIPTGTGNDFARTLGSDRRNPLVAARLLAKPRIRRVDAIKLTNGDGSDRIYVNVAGAGFDSAVNETANRMRTRMTGTGKYVVALGKTLRRYQPSSFMIRIDDEGPRTLDAMMVAVANGRSYGGGMRVNPAGSISDGKLEVCIVQAMGKGEFLRSFPKVFRGTHVNHPKVTMLNGARVRLEADRELQVYADGEHAGPLPASFEVLPGALQVVMP